MFAPKGTPPEIVKKLNDALVKALDDENTKKRLLDLGGVLPTASERTPEGLQELVVSEVARWTPVLKAAGVTAD
jgi:tripartite-type tricarboxylate transporter receptor subunit TctC